MPSPKGKKIVHKGAEYKGILRRKTIASLYLRGCTQAEIGFHPEFVKANDGKTVTQAIISKELNILRNQWLESSLRDFDEAKARELARIDYLEEVAWKEWDRSREKTVIDVRKVEEAPRKTVNNPRGSGRKTDKEKDEEYRMMVVRQVNEKKVIERLGDPRFLDQVKWCIEQRLKILGAYKQSDAGPNNGSVLNQIIVDWSKPQVPRDLIDPVEERIRALTEGVKEETQEDDSCSTSTK